MSMKEETRSPTELAERYSNNILEQLRVHTVALLELVPPSEQEICKVNIELYDEALGILEKNS